MSDLSRFHLFLCGFLVSLPATRRLLTKRAVCGRGTVYVKAVRLDLMFEHIVDFEQTVGIES